MRVKLYGIQPMSFADQETGELVAMTKLHVLGLVIEKDSTANGMMGQRCGAVNTKLDCSKLEIGKNYDLVYELPLGSSAKAKARLMDIVPIS